MDDQTYAGKTISGASTLRAASTKPVSDPAAGAVGRYVASGASQSTSGTTAAVCALIKNIAPTLIHSGALGTAGQAESHRILYAPLVHPARQIVSGITFRQAGHGPHQAGRIAPRASATCRPAGNVRRQARQRTFRSADDADGAAIHPSGSDVQLRRECAGSVRLALPCRNNHPPGTAARA